MTDIARILQPIPGPSPAGVSLRYEAAYDQIREARREEDPSLPQGVWRRDVKRADWQQVAKLCEEALAERSKDLQIAAWLTEALVHIDGVPGLIEGLRILGGLSDAFWPELFPPIDGDDLTARLATFEWLNERPVQALYVLPLTRSGTGEPVSYSWTEYANAQLRGPARGDAADQPTIEDILASAAATPTAFYEALGTHLAEAGAGIDKLQEILRRYCAAEAPGFGQLRGALDNLLGFADTTLADRADARPPPPAPPPPRAPESREPVVAAESPASPLIRIASRDEAYRLLIQIADYLFTVEPHSPTPYIVQRAASWGMMPLHKLLVELTKGSNDLTTLFELLGIDPEGSDAPGRRSTNK